MSQYFNRSIHVKQLNTYSDIQNFQTFYRKKVKEDKIDD